jgi:hypothetical protein
MAAFRPTKTKDVFTPNKAATLTYVPRTLIENDFERHFEQPGNQIVIYGHSGSGKTTLVRNTLTKKKRRFVRTHCETATTFVDILLSGFDSLNKYYVKSRTHGSSSSIAPEMTLSYGDIKASLKPGSATSTQANTEERVVPVQLTPQRLAEFMGVAKCTWIIEDFHKVKETEKKRIADVMKIFIDTANDYPDTKIICIGAVATARELIELDSNLMTRVSEIPVPLLKDEEIGQIIVKGFGILNISATEDLINKVVYYSNNLASVCHQLCSDICHRAGIEKTRVREFKVSDDGFRFAIEAFVRKNSDTFLKWFEMICVDRTGRMILRAFNNHEKEALSLQELCNASSESKPERLAEYEAFLTRMLTVEYNEVLRLDARSKKYSISNPFFAAYVKIRFALEKTERKEREAKMSKKRKKAFDLTSPEMEESLISLNSSIVWNTESLKDYYSYLNHYRLTPGSRYREMEERLQRMVSEQVLYRSYIEKAQPGKKPDDDKK